MIQISTKPKNDKQWEIDKQAVEIKGLEQYIRLQKIWSWIIGIILGISTVTTWLFIFFLGIGWLNYEAYPGLPHTILGTFFAEVIGLSYIVAKYLFPQK